MAAIGMSCCGSGIATFFPSLENHKDLSYSVAPLVTDLLSGSLMLNLSVSLQCPVLPFTVLALIIAMLIEDTALQIGCLPIGLIMIRS